MNPVVFHIASGDSYFTGIALVFAALACFRSRSSRVKRLTGVAMILGVVAIALSSTAIPYWIYAVTGLTLVAWMISGLTGRWQTGTTWAATIAIVTMLLAELPWHRVPNLSPVSRAKMTVIADSVTAGIGSEETAERWPAILQRQHHIEIQDISHVGETAASALQRTQQHSIDSPVILIEIGGNDLLGGAPSSARFERDLNALLAHVSGNDRQVVMFELPLPPLYHEYGRIQREAATRHQVYLIPRRQFLSVLASGDATLDSIHLSQAGHQSMADCVWKTIRTAFDPETP